MVTSHWQQHGTYQGARQTKAIGLDRIKQRICIQPRTQVHGGASRYLAIEGHRGQQSLCDLFSIAQ